MDIQTANLSTPMGRDGWDTCKECRWTENSIEYSLEEKVESEGKHTLEKKCNEVGKTRSQSIQFCKEKYNQLEIKKKYIKNEKTF